MEKSFVRFLLKAGVVAIILSSLAFFQLGNYTKTFLASRFHFFNLFVFSVTSIIHYFLIKQSNKRVQKFINSFMLSMTLKLMLFFIVIVAYAFTHKSEAAPFIVSFFIMYLVYTILEVFDILQFLKINQDKS